MELLDVRELRERGEQLVDHHERIWAMRGGTISDQPRIKRNTVVVITVVAGPLVALHEAGLDSLRREEYWV